MTARNAVHKQSGLARLGLLVYSLGIALGLLITLLAIWGDLEASLFDTMFRPETRLSNLSCPVLITADEEAPIRAAFQNDSDREENLNVRAHISQGFVSLIREETTSLILPPGGEERLEWRIFPDDAAWDRVVLVRISTVRNLPYRQLVGNSCGVLLVPVTGVTGSQIVLVALVAGLVMTTVGAGLWYMAQRRPLSEQDQKNWRMIYLLSGLIGLALVISLLQYWLLAMIILLILVLLAISATDAFNNLKQPGT